MHHDDFQFKIRIVNFLMSSKYFHEFNRKLLILLLPRLNYQIFKQLFINFQYQIVRYICNIIIQRIYIKRERKKALNIQDTGKFKCGLKCLEEELFGNKLTEIQECWHVSRVIRSGIKGFTQHRSIIISAFNKYKNRA